MRQRFARWRKRSRARRRRSVRGWSFARSAAWASRGARYSDRVPHPPQGERRLRARTDGPSPGGGWRRRWSVTASWTAAWHRSDKLAGVAVALLADAHVGGPGGHGRDLAEELQGLEP